MASGFRGLIARIFGQPPQVIPGTASVARQRLAVILAHESDLPLVDPARMPQFRADLVELFQKYLNVDGSDMYFSGMLSAVAKVRSEAGVDVFELSLPLEKKHAE